MGLVKGEYIKYGMAVGADTAQGRPADALEYTASAGAAAYIIGEKQVMAEIEGTFSLTQDVPDFWRRDGAEYPQHGGRFTGEPSYFRHVIGSTRGLMKKLGTTPDDYDYVVFHEPNGKFPLKAAKILGFHKKSVSPGLVVTQIGNTYSASSLIGLAAVLDQAKPEERILVTSYGSGAGSDSFSIVVTDNIYMNRDAVPSVNYYINRKQYVDYALYSKLRRQFRGLKE
jgi:hydroxymethylglutaryl-CoA synthase